MKRNPTDETLTPYAQVAEMYNLRHPHAKITQQTAQKIGNGALLKLRHELKGKQWKKRQTRST